MRAADQSRISFLAILTGLAGIVAPSQAAVVTKTLARFAAESCLPGASPLPLDLFSLAEGALAEELNVSWDDAAPDDLTLAVPAASPLWIPGIAAVELLLPEEVGFTATPDCDGGTMRFSSSEFNLALRLKPGGDFFPRAAGGGAAIEVSRTVVLDVTYPAADGVSPISIRPGGGGGGGGGGGAGAGIVFPIAPGSGFQIGATGIVVESADIVLESTGSARAPFRLGVENVNLSFESELLAFLNDDLASLTLDDFSITGTGLSGGFVYDPAGDCAPGRLFDSAEDDFCLQSLELRFAENAITLGKIAGRLKPPFFKDHGFNLAGCGGDGYLGIEIALQADGELRVAFTCPEIDPIHIKLDEAGRVFDLTVRAIDFERSPGGSYRFRVDGDLDMTFLTQVGADRSFSVPVERFTVSSEGDISLDGGWVRLPQPEKFDFHGFAVTVRGFSFGSSGGETWIGLDAEISLTEILPLHGSVRGFRAIWRNDDPLGTLKLELDGIAIDFRQAGVVSFKGDIRWAANDSDDPEAEKNQVFHGDVRLAIESINLTVDAQLTVGKQGRTRFFFVQLFTELPTGVPIFSGVSLYGLGGLFASNLQPNVGAFSEPLLWYAEQDRCPGETEPCLESPPGTPAPWRIEPGALAFGAGALIGSTDNGYAVNVKASLLISIPGPLISFSGKGNILKNRSSLSSGEDPTFNAYAIYTPELFEIGVGVNYELSPVLKIKADAEASFSQIDPSLWHVYLGQVGGREIQAKVVELFKAKAFLMIHPERTDLAVDGSQFDLCGGIPTPDIAFGAGAGFDEDYSLGPLGIALRALIAAWAGISFDPIHFQGGSSFDGGVELRAFGFSLGIDLGAHLLFQTPTPFVLDGEFHVKLKLPWPLPDPKATVHVRWDSYEDPSPVDPVLHEVQLTARDGSSGIPAVLVDDAAIPDDFGDPVPLDFVPNIIFSRPMNDEMIPKFFGGDLADPSPFEDTVRGGCDAEAPDPSRLRYSYHVTKTEVSAQPSDAIAAFPEGAAAGPQPQGVWLPEPRKDTGPDDVETTVAYPGRVLVLYDPNPFSHFAASSLLIEDAGGGDGGGAGTGASKVSLAEWLVARTPCLPPCRRLTQGATHCDCPPSGVSVGEPCFFLPYSVYRIKVVMEVRENGAHLADEEKFAYFQTQGPPLDLTPYVHEVLPGSASRPHFQNYHLAVRFNQGYLDALYAAGDAGGAVICGGVPTLRARVLDSGRKVLRSETRIATYFRDAADHVDPVHDGGVGKSPAEVFKERGGTVLLDDVLHIPVDSDAALPALRPGERHIVQVLWHDSRLERDIQLYEFPFLLSKFRNLRHVFSTFAEPGKDCDWSRGSYRGSFFNLPVEVPDPAWDDAEDVLDVLAQLLADHPGLAAYASRLRDAHPTAAPSEVEERTLRVWANRVKTLLETFDGIAGAELVIGNSSLPLLRDGWERERAAFEQLDKLFGLERHLQPLPEVVELSVLRRGGEAKGFLLELPEPLDLSRISQIAAVQGLDQGLRVVKDAAGARFFFFAYDAASRSIQTLPGGKWSIEMSYQAVLDGWLTPALRRTDGFEQEGAGICFDLSNDLFR